MDGCSFVNKNGGLKVAAIFISRRRKNQCGRPDVEARGAAEGAEEARPDPICMVPPRDDPPSENPRPPE